jgi:hypothetical protein
MSAPRVAMLTVYDGDQTIGFLLRRGPAGVEAFTADNNSLGLFENDDTAASAVWRHARGQARGDSAGETFTSIGKAATAVLAKALPTEQEEGGHG